MTKRRVRRSAKPAKAKVTKKRTTTRRKRSGNPFEIDRVPTLI